MAFRFNNPLRDIANTNTALNRGLGQFGQVSSALDQFNNVQKNIGRISSSIGQISGNASSLGSVFSSANSAGGIINNLSGNSSLQNTFRSVSALTGDIQSLVPGNSRVGSQAVTLSKRAEDIFSNVQGNEQGIKGISGGITDVLNGSLDVGSLAGRSLGPLTGGLNLGQLSGLSNTNLFGGFKAANISSGLSNTKLLGGFKAANISSGTLSALSNITSNAPELQNIINNPISVVPRSVAELTSPIGERYDGIREVVTQLSTESPFSDYTSSTFKPFSVSPVAQDRNIGQFKDLPQAAFSRSERAGASYSKLPNPLRNFS